MALLELTLESALSTWKEQLSDRRQPWPEWEALSKRVHETTFTLVTATVVDPAAGELPCFHLVGGVDNDGLHLVHRVRTELDLWPDDLPPYVEPLWELRRAPFDELPPDVVAGAIADGLPGYPLSLLRARGELGSVLGWWADGADASELPELPEGAESYQSTCAGGMFCRDRAQNILVYSSGSGRFEVVGPLSAFTRYCLGYVLSGRDWFNDGYLNEGDLAAYGLRFVGEPEVD